MYSLCRKKAESCIIKVKKMNKITTYPGYEFVSPDILKQLELINSTSDYQLSITVSFLNHYLYKYSYRESKTVQSELFAY